VCDLEISKEMQKRELWFLPSVDLFVSSKEHSPLRGIF
jgi:hypothetical protein